MISSAGAPAVLVTRPLPGAIETMARLTAMGLRPLLAPSLVIDPLPAAWPPPRSVQAILVTSANALAYLPESCRVLPLLAVGAASARQARERGFTQVHSADGDAMALARLAHTMCAPAGLPLLLAHGLGQATELARMLGDAGFIVVSVPVYVARPVASLSADALAAWRARDIASALFFSTETARAFIHPIAMAGEAEAACGIAAIAISPVVATALRALPWRRIITAARPDQDAMLELLL